MARRYTKDRSKRSQLLSDFDCFVFNTVCGEIDDPLCLKDLDGKFIFANSAYLRFIGVPLDTPVEGRTEDNILPDTIFSPGADFAYDDVSFKKNRGLKISIIRESARTISGSYDFYQFDRSPVLIEGIHSAYLIIGRKKFIFSLADFFKGNSPSAVKTLMPNDIFTDREWDVVFFMQQNLNRDQIAEMLDTTPGTVKNHISHIYKKARSKNLAQLIEFCSKRDLLHFISIKNIIARKRKIFL